MQDPVAIPSKLSNGLIYTQTQAPNGTASLLLDSKAATCELAADRVFGGKTGQTVSVDFGSVSVDVRLVSREVAARDSYGSDGVLGIPFFERYAVGLDYANLTSPISVWPSDISLRNASRWLLGSRPGPLNIIPLSRGLGKYLVSVSDIGTPMNLAFSISSGISSVPAAMVTPSAWIPLGKVSTPADPRGYADVFATDPVKIGQCHYRWGCITSRSGISVGSLAPPFLGSERLVVDFHNLTLYSSGIATAQDEWEAAIQSFCLGRGYVSNQRLIWNLDMTEGATTKQLNGEVLSIGELSSNAFLSGWRESENLPEILSTIEKNLLVEGHAKVLIQGEPRDVQLSGGK